MRETVLDFLKIGAALAAACDVAESAKGTEQHRHGRRQRHRRKPIIGDVYNFGGK